MAFKLRSGNKTNFKQMGSSPAKVAGIFVGEGEDRIRIGSEEAAEREAEGEKITRTAADNPDKEEGAQQIKNLGETYAEIDAELQDTAEGKEKLDSSEYNYRRTQDPDEMIRMMSDGPVTVKDAEKTIRKHENLEGGNPMSVPGGIKYYNSKGEEITEEQYNDAMNKKKTTTTTTKSTTTGPKIEGDMFSKENQAKLREYYKSLNK
tara:strand:+ start:89 stop:706 length:618 start_codon:yes stop_codon:yes gene_type:complete